MDHYIKAVMNIMCMLSDLITKRKSKKKKKNPFRLNFTLSLIHMHIPDALCRVVFMKYL